jgi:hypothetical protein
MLISKIDRLKGARMTILHAPPGALAKDRQHHRAVPRRSLRFSFSSLPERARSQPRNLHHDTIGTHHTLPVTAAVHFGFDDVRGPLNAAFPPAEPLLPRLAANRTNGLASQVLDLRIRRTANSAPSRSRSRRLTSRIFQDDASCLLARRSKNEIAAVAIRR